MELVSAMTTSASECVTSPTKSVWERERERDGANLWGWREWGTLHLDHSHELIHKPRSCLMSMTTRRKCTSSITRCRCHCINVGYDHKCHWVRNIADRKCMGKRERKIERDGTGLWGWRERETLHLDHSHELIRKPGTMFNEHGYHQKTHQ